MEEYNINGKTIKVYNSKIRSVLGANKVDLYEAMQVPGIKSIIKLFDVFGRIKEEEGNLYISDPEFQSALSAALLYIALWDDFAKWYCNQNNNNASKDNASKDNASKE